MRQKQIYNKLVLHIKIIILRTQICAVAYFEEASFGYLRLSKKDSRMTECIGKYIIHTYQNIYFHKL